MGRPVAMSLVFLGVLASGIALAAVGIAWNLPWLVAENRRIQPWKVPLVWSSEAAAFLVFLRYCLSRILPSWRSLASPSRLTLRGFLIASALDLGFSVSEMVEDRVMYLFSVPAKAEVTAGYSFPMPLLGQKRYSFHCAFRDQAGRVQRAWFSMPESIVPLRVQLGVDNGQLPVVLDVLYDPWWPPRNWLADLGYSDDNRVSIYSLLTLMLSGSLSALLAVLGKEHQGFPPPEIAPFLGAGFFLCLAGMVQGW